MEVASSGTEGLSIARERPADLVVLDVMMPGLDGLQVLDTGTRLAHRGQLEVYVRQLRQKLESGGEPRLIHTVRGAGYVLRKE